MTNEIKNDREIKDCIQGIEINGDLVKRQVFQIKSDPSNWNQGLLNTYAAQRKGYVLQLIARYLELTGN
jgi:hypothetical protein